MSELALAALKWALTPKNWAYVAIAALAAVLVAQHLAMSMQGREIDALKRSVAEANQAAAAAKAQAQLNSNITDAIDKASTKEAAVTVRTQGAVDAVQHATGASSALPSDVVRSWGAGIDGLREPPDPDAASGSRAAEPADPVLAPG